MDVKCPWSFIQLLRTMRDQHLAVRGLKKLERHISWEEVVAARTRLTPYKANCKRLQAPAGTGVGPRTAAAVPLAALVRTQAAILAAENRLPEVGRGGFARVIVCLDGTTMWKCAMTRCDATLVADPTVPHVRRTTSWSAWWVMDGGDQHRALQVLDGQMALNQQVCPIVVHSAPLPMWCGWECCHGSSRGV